MANAYADILAPLIKGVAGDVVESVLHAVQPRAFEAYLLTLELRKGKKNTGISETEGSLIDVFTFPINPNGISKIEPQLTNIKKTLTGVSVTKTPDFVPQTLTIRGDFGRDWKLSIDSIEGFTHSWVETPEESIYFLKNNAPGGIGLFNGFGLIKRLQSFAERAAVFDAGNVPRELYLHNHALSETYRVETHHSTYSQDYSRNKIWQYEIVYDIVDQVDGFRKKGWDTSARILISAASKIAGKAFGFVLSATKQAIK